MSGVQAFASVSALDLTQGVAGAYCTQLLADGGADVVRVQPVRPELAAFARGKRATLLDLATSGDCELFDRIALAADVIVDDLPPSEFGRLAISYDGLRQRNSALITCSIRLRRAEDHGDDEPEDPELVAEAASAILDKRRDRTGAPVRHAFPLAEMTSGLAAYAAIASALFARGRSGRGDHVQVSKIQTLVALNTINLTGVQVPTALGMSTAAWGTFATQDGHVVIGVNSNSLWARLCHSMGRPDLATDPRYAGYAERDSRVEEVNNLVREWTGARTSAEVVAAIAPSGVPVGQVAKPADVLANPLLRRLGYFVRVDAGDGRALDIPADPFGFTPRETLAAT